MHSASRSAKTSRPISVAIPRTTTLTRTTPPSPWPMAASNGTLFEFCESYDID